MSMKKTSWLPPSGSPLLTAAQMRAIERTAIDGGAVSGLELMERAGRGVVSAVFDAWPDLAAAPHAAVVLCGPGNNGGDGYVVARLLRNRGWHVDVFALGDPDRLPADAAVNRAAWAPFGRVTALEALTPAVIEGSDLVVDALFGTGLTRGFEPPPGLGQAFHDLFGEDGPGKDAVPSPRVVAVDIVSGIDADSGRVLATGGPWVGVMAAHLTVTFHAPKLGHVLADGPRYCRQLSVVDIGLEASMEEDPAVARAVDPVARPEVRARLGKGGARAGHKYDHGHALVLSGPMGRSGAARLAARAALRVGAGLVTVVAPESAMLENACQLTAVMLRRCDGPEALAELLGDERVTSICLGPGLGVGEGTAALVEVALAASATRSLGVVLDADALTSFRDGPERLFSLTRANCGVVLTPHDGEFARLFPDLADRLRDTPTEGPAVSRLDAVRAAAERAGCVVLLKGPDTVIAAPDGRARVHVAAYDRAAPWLATAGAGDVLAGMIAGFLAWGFGGAASAEASAWLHVEAARAFGPGLTAEDLPETLPRVFRDLGL
jgi:hydroxyethylthiazole kinase-like uncharacterized protein yjeF